MTWQVIGLMMALHESFCIALAFLVLSDIVLPTRDTQVFGIIRGLIV
jgi:hypothetical protein